MRRCISIRCISAISVVNTIKRGSLIQSGVLIDEANLGVKIVPKEEKKK